MTTRPSERDAPVSIELRYSRWLVALVGAVVLLFAVSSLVSEVVSRRVDDEIRRLREEALPSLAQLGAARSALRRIDRAATELAGEAHSDRSVFERDLGVARRQLDTALVGYLELRPFGNERERYPEVQRRLGALDVAIQELLDAHHIGGSGGIVAEKLDTAAEHVDIGVEALDEVLEGLVQLGGQEASTAAARLATSRRASGRVGLALDAACVVIAVFAALLAAKAARRAFSLAVEEQRAKELEDFAQRVAHDLLSPLSSLTYCVGTLKRRAGPDATAQRAALRATACVHRAQQLVKSIFEFSRAGALPDPSAHAVVADVLAGVLEDVVGSVETEDEGEEGEALPKVEVAVAEDVEVACSPGVLASLLGNLVSNAVKFTRGVPERRVQVRVVGRGAMVRVEVEDNGPGLPPEFAEHAFEAYQRAPGVSEPGLGLGLATVRRFAEAHGGASGYRPAPRGGAVFWFELPRHEPGSAPASLPAPPRALH